ncbi:hypothetical protein GIB67_028540 [Kingdonia uniflora]|uniref:F-box domain-containing protein n=1 Tax=Kingdonia uniflora TaxID=39325 RepID=A0A7J7KVX0_9MAGN|nr:hypothetical protein GIB67_028540 [Kingdonia uniflora]
MKEDKISHLSDNILQHILSYLPIKAVVRTSAFSKSWEKVWTEVPNLDFTEKFSYCMEQDQAREIINSVESMLSSRDMTCCIEKFWVGLCGDVKESNISAWVRNISSRNVKDVVLILYPKEIVSLHSSLFNTESVTSLKLELNSNVLVLPTKIHLPKLKCLLLKNIRFECADAIQRIVSSTNALEELTIYFCKLLDQKKLVLSLRTSAYTLEKLAIAFKVQLVEDSNNEARLESSDLKTGLSLPRLKVLHLLNISFETDNSFTEILSRFPNGYACDDRISAFGRELLEDVKFWKDPGVPDTMKLGTGDNMFLNLKTVEFKLFRSCYKETSS